MTPNDVRARYGYGDWYRPAAIAVNSLAGLAALGFFAFVLTRGVPVAAVVCCLPGAVLAGLLIYRRLWCHAYRLELRGDRIFWQAPLRHGWLPVRGLYTIERERLLNLHNGFRRVLFRPFDGRTLAVSQFLNLAPFIEAVLAIEPRIEVLPSAWARGLGIQRRDPTAQ